MTAITDDVALKEKHRAMWASGDYARVADDLVTPMGEVLVEACAPSAGTRVLDVAAGSGNVAIKAAMRGADVVASDLTPELFDAGRAGAAAAGVNVSWEQGDAERLPYADGSFDMVLSCVGVMFAPHHQEAADELVRVCRPGGRIGLANWTPGGFIGQMFATMKPFAPPPPPGASPAPLWGSEDHVRGLFGDRVDDLAFERRLVTIPFASGVEFRDYFKAYYGPTIAAFRFNADDVDRVAALDTALAEFGDAHVTNGRMQWEYLLVTGRRA
jgi:SAM-dependent methyltransferase